MRLLASLSFLAALAACNAYDPDLGPAPFRCDPDGRCPDGYSCVEQICERAGGGDPVDEPDADPGQNLECNDDSSIEPNDQTANATATGITTTDACTCLVQLAVCPESDQDLYWFRTVGNNTSVRATIKTDVGAGELQLQILNGSGTVTSTGIPTSGTRIDVSQANLSQGTWYVRVQAPESAPVENNYTFELATCTNPADCNNACAGCP